MRTKASPGTSRRVPQLDATPLIATINSRTVRTWPCPRSLWIFRVKDVDFSR